MEGADVNERISQVLLEITEVPHIAAQTDMVAEVAHGADPDVESGRVFRGVRYHAPIDVRPYDPDASGHIRTNAQATRSADRDADNHVAHDRECVVRDALAEEVR